MKHKYQLGQEVRVIAKEDSRNAASYVGEVGVIIALTTKPEYSSDYVLAMKGRRSSQYPNKSHKLHVDADEIVGIEKVKAFAYKIKGSDEIVWRMKDIAKLRGMERVPELDMEKVVSK